MQNNLIISICFLSEAKTLRSELEQLLPDNFIILTEYGFNDIDASLFDLIICDYSYMPDLYFELVSNRNTLVIPNILLLKHPGDEISPKSVMDTIIDEIFVLPCSSKEIAFYINHINGYRFLDLPTHHDAIETVSFAKERFLEKIQEIVISETSHKQLSLGIIAFKFGMNTLAFSKKVKALTGMSGVKYILKLRLEHAANLLMYKEFPLQEVAALTGFISFAYFSRAFAEHYGVLPSFYRKSGFQPL